MVVAVVVFLFPRPLVPFHHHLKNRLFPFLFLLFYVIPLMMSHPTIIFIVESNLNPNDNIWTDIKIGIVLFVLFIDKGDGFVVVILVILIMLHLHRLSVRCTSRNIPKTTMSLFVPSGVRYKKMVHLEKKMVHLERYCVIVFVFCGGMKNDDDVVFSVKQLLVSTYVLTLKIY